VDVVALAESGGTSLGRHDAPAGHYDRVWVVIDAGHAAARDGSAVPLAVYVEPIAISFELRHDEQIEITVRLIALAQTDGSYDLFTKSATLTEIQNAAHPS
jgi:hypothetical protein